MFLKINPLPIGTGEAATPTDKENRGVVTLGARCAFEPEVFQPIRSLSTESHEEGVTDLG